MKGSIPSYVHNSQWDCPEKQDARAVTIIDLYKEITGLKSIPEDKQYWTMAGAYVYRDGPLKGEFGQLIENNLIKPEQFHAVDREQIIIDNNRKLLPNINWYCGDFYKIMDKAAIQKTFNPMIINYDGVMQPKHGMNYLKKILTLIDNNVNDELILVSNFILDNPYTHSKKYKYTIDDALEELRKIYWFPDHLSLIKQSYVYKRENTNGKMGISIFTKKKHKKPNLTKNRIL